MQCLPYLCPRPLFFVALVHPRVHTGGDSAGAHGDRGVESAHVPQKGPSETLEGVALRMIHSWARLRNGVSTPELSEPFNMGEFEPIEM